MKVDENFAGLEFLRNYTNNVSDSKREKNECPIPRMGQYSYPMPIAGKNVRTEENDEKNMTDASGGKIPF